MQPQYLTTKELIRKHDERGMVLKLLSQRCFKLMRENARLGILALILSGLTIGHSLGIIFAALQ
jgi:hypothetical protein